jgi:stage II sporulation protein D
MVKIAAVILAALGLQGSAPAKHAHRLAQPLPAIFVSGHGWGHGIGMAQYGAYGYALHGWTYDRIVLHYYPGTTLGEADPHKVRVLLAERSRRVVISSKTAFVVRDGNGKRHRLSAGVQALGPGLKLRLGAGKRLRALPGPLLFSSASQPLSLGSRGYRGALRVERLGSGLRVVDIVGIEQYLWGVVPSEMPDRWPAEALAAQAVVARTYALAHLRKGPFDLYSDTRDQVYRGIAAESPGATAAVTETAGKVVLYDDELAETYFFSSSGGRTANVQDVWPKAKAAPYLVSVPDPYDTLSPYHDWGPIRFNPTVLAKRLHVPGSVKDFHANVSASGRVRTVTFVGTRGEKTVDGSAIRTALGLRSTWFRLGLLNLTNPGGTVVYGSLATLAGVARGTPRVSLEARAYGGSWRKAGRLTVRNGVVSPVVRPRVTTDYRLESGGFRSGAVRVSVAPLVQLVAGTDGLSVTGTVRPVLPGAAMQVQRQASGGGWATVAQATVASDGSFSAQLDLTSGNYRARVAAGRGFAVGLSRTVVVP